MGAPITQIAFLMVTDMRHVVQVHARHATRPLEALLVRLKEAKLDSMPVPRDVDALVTDLWQKLHGTPPPERSTIELLERLVDESLDDAAAEADDARSSSRELSGIVDEPGDQ